MLTLKGVMRLRVNKKGKKCRTEGPQEDWTRGKLKGKWKKSGILKEIGQIQEDVAHTKD